MKEYRLKLKSSQSQPNKLLHKIVIPLLKSINSLNICSFKNLKYLNYKAIILLLLADSSPDQNE